ncbi:hypothetical protein L7F22_040113 [Adiantum nelumboides]|nr:hypothetical protein [Adiantum nelumboides]
MLGVARGYGIECHSRRCMTEEKYQRGRQGGRSSHLMMCRCMRAWQTRRFRFETRRGPARRCETTREPGCCSTSTSSKCGADPKYLVFVQDRMDVFVTADDNILTYNKLEYNLDNVRSGTVLLFLWKQTENIMYKKASHLLRDQLKTHPCSKEDNFWYKLIYPYQMWLDGLFMAEPFYAQYALMFKEPGHFNDIALQPTLMEKRVRDAKMGCCITVMMSRGNRHGPTLRSEGPPASGGEPWIGTSWPWWTH